MRVVKMWKNDRIETAHFKRIKLHVRKRDGYKCQMCGKYCGKKYGQIHHIRPWSDNVYLRYSAMNLCLLCTSCHHSIKNNEAHWVGYLSTKARENERKYNERKK